MRYALVLLLMSVAVAGVACDERGAAEVDAATALRAPAPSGAALLVSPAIDIDPALTLPRAGIQDPMAIVFAGGHYTVFWRDYPAIFATRIAVDGTRLDPIGVRLFDDGFIGLYDFDVASDGQQIVVAYMRDGVIYARRLALDLTALDDAAIEVVPSGTGANSPTIAAGAGTFLIAWQRWQAEPYSPGDIFARRLTAGGTLLDPTPILVSGGNPDDQRPEAAYDGTNFLLAWVRGAPAAPAVLGARLTLGGQLLDDAVVLSGLPAAITVQPHLAFDGTRYLLLWVEDVNDQPDVVVTRVTPDLLVLDPQPISIAAGPGAQWAIDVVHDGNRFLVLWLDKATSTAKLASRFVDSDGALTAPVVIATDPPADFFHFAAGASAQNSLILWEDSGTRIDQGGVALDPAGLRYASQWNQETVPRVAAGPNGLLTVWADTRAAAPKYGIYGMASSNDGAPLAPTATLLSSNHTDVASPAVAANGGTYLVVWVRRWSNGDSALFALRLGADGSALDPAPFALTLRRPTAIYAPTVTAGSDGFLVVWEEPESNPSWTDLFGRRVRTDGSLPDPASFPVVMAPGRQSSPSVAFDGTGYLLVWLQDTAVRAVRLDAAGSTLPPGIVELAAGGPDVHRDPALAVFGAGGFLVTWRDWDSGTYRGSMVGTVIPAAGPLAPGVNLTLVDRHAPLYAHGIAFDGSSFLTVWEGVGVDFRIDLFATRISTNGVSLDTNGFTVAEMPPSEGQPVVAASGVGRFVAAYCATGPGPDDPAQIQARLVELQPAGAPCATAAACATDACVDGVCCDSACGGGDATDCQACSVSAGAAADGTCGPVLGGWICRAAAGACDQSEQCDGSAVACPADLPAADGAPCSDVNACTTVDRCVAGSCQGTTPVVCEAIDQCHAAGSCDPASGVCGQVAKPNGTACDDGNPCTLADACQAGACTSGALNECPAADPCHAAAACDPVDGSCTNPAQPDGTSCPGGVCVDGTCEAAPDAAVLDAASGGAADAAVADAGGATDDAGADAATVDAAATDAAASDAATGDAAAADAASPGPASDADGCACATGGAPSTGSGLLVVAAFLGAVRRRRGRRQRGC